MKRSLCLFPKDNTTEFLRPVYELLCKDEKIIGFENDAIEDDNYFETLENLLKEVDGIIFLGHGSSKTLYGTNLNPIIDDKTSNLEYLKNKQLLLFSCKSSDFIKNYNLHNAIGFGFIPTSKDDACEGAKLHGQDISCLKHEDLHYFQDAITRILIRTLQDTSWDKTYVFIRKLSFYTDIEIVEILLNHKNLPNYRLVADMLYYLKYDIKQYD